MNICYKKIILVLLISISALPLFPQEAAGSELSAADMAKLNLDKARALYEEGRYEECSIFTDTCIAEFEEKKTFYPPGIQARFYLIKGSLVYVNRKEGYREEIESLFRQAIKLDLDLEIGDSRNIPLFLIDLYKKLKSEYLDNFSKETRRNTIGVVTTLICQTDFELASIQPGLHYAFNINNNFSVSGDIKVPLQGSFWNFWRIKTGVNWFPSSRVEQFIFGIGLYDITDIDNWKLIKTSVSFCGHNEFIFRSGMGFAVDVEVLRFDLLFSQADSGTVSLSPLELGNNLRLFYANIDFYVMVNF